MLSTVSIILNGFSAYIKHNSAKSTIGIFVNLLMWWDGDLLDRNAQYASTDRDPKRCSQKDRPEDGTPFVNENGRRFGGRFLSLNVDRTWDVIPPPRNMTRMG